MLASLRTGHRRRLRGPDAARAATLATGIAIQNVPEGLVVALALRGAGYSRMLSAGLGMASGLIEPIGAVLGASIVTVSAALLPWGLAFAAGAMLFVVTTRSFQSRTARDTSGLQPRG